MSTIFYGTVRVTPAGNLTRKDAAAFLGMKPKTLAEWAARSQGPHGFKIGGRVFYRFQELKAFAGSDC